MDCFRCHTKMNKMVSKKAGVIVDVCPSCDGLWLDAGEWDNLVESHGCDREKVKTQLAMEIVRE